MKKILFFALLSLNLFAIDFYVGGTMNAGATEWNPKANPITKDEYKGVAYGINFELTQAIPFVELGMGIGYESGYKLGSASYDVLPIYGLAKFNLFPVGVKPYVVAKYGKVIYDNEKNVSLKDGAFYSAGVGITVFKKLQIEGGYSLSTGKKNGEDLDVTKATIALRYNVF